MNDSTVAVAMMRGTTGTCKQSRGIGIHCEPHGTAHVHVCALSLSNACPIISSLHSSRLPDEAIALNICVAWERSGGALVSSVGCHPSQEGQVLRELTLVASTSGKLNR